MWRSPILRPGPERFVRTHFEKLISQIFNDDTQFWNKSPNTSLGPRSALFEILTIQNHYLHYLLYWETLFSLCTLFRLTTSIIYITRAHYFYYWQKDVKLNTIRWIAHMFLTLPPTTAYMRWGSGPSKTFSVTRLTKSWQRIRKSSWSLDIWERSEPTDIVHETWAGLDI